MLVSFAVGEPSAVYYFVLVSFAVGEPLAVYYFVLVSFAVGEPSAVYYFVLVSFGCWLAFGCLLLRVGEVCCWWLLVKITVLLSGAPRSAAPPLQESPHRRVMLETPNRDRTAGGQP